MNAWKHMTPQSVTFGLLIAGLVTWLFALPILPQTTVINAQTTAIVNNLQQHIGQPLFFITWFVYSNLLVLCRREINGLGILLGILLGFTLGILLGGAKPKE